MSDRDISAVFITGCSDGGIGSGLVFELLARGYIVYASARSLDSMDALSSHNNLHKVKADVTDLTSIQAAISVIYEDGHEIDILICNAGLTCVDPLLDVSLDRAKLVMDTNFFGVVRTVQCVVPRMVKRGKGLVVTMGSILGEIGSPFSGLYNASKAALQSYTEMLGQECKSLGVRVMLVSAGSVRSNIVNNQKKTLEAHEDSFYKDYTVQIERRLNASQTSRTMDTTEFCKRVVDQATRSTPPAYITLGGGSVLWSILKWLPRETALNLIWYPIARK